MYSIVNNDLIDFVLFTLVLMAMLSAVAFGFYLHIKKEKEKEKKAERNRKKNNITAIAKSIIETCQKVEPSDDGILAASSIFVGAIGLEFFAKKINPKYIIGVNRGGWLLSTYLAQRLEVSRDKLLRFKSDEEDANKGEFLDEFTLRIGESILLIDDISRTGNSLKIARDRLIEKFPGIELSIAVLVVCANNKIKKEITCHPYYTTTPDIALPWSSETRKKEARECNRSGKRSISISDDNVLEAHPPIIKMSDENYKDGIDIVTKDVDIVMQLLDAITA
jgi:hypoxanthine phosphoribosyltransferase